MLAVVSLSCNMPNRYAPLGAYRHGLRVSELVHLRGDQIVFDTANLAVRRIKKGVASDTSDPW